MAEVTTTDGVRLAYQQFGAGPDLVFVHGLAASRAFWFASYAMPLARSFRVTLFDLRGHGYSSMPASGYQPSVVANDVLALLDALAIERCTLIGHSYGGAVALEFAGQHPSRVERLAVMDTKVSGLQPLQHLSDSSHLTQFERNVAARSGHDWQRETQVGMRFLEVLARWSVEDRPLTEGPAARDAFTPFGEGRGAARAAKQYLQLIDTTSARDDVVQPGLDAETIRGLPMPALWLYGEWSRCMPTFRKLQALRPADEFRVVPEGGHFFPASHAPLVLGWLRDFLGVPLAVAQR
jgi:pimeloyl-ACP methyl ester carboxylesterase